MLTIRIIDRVDAQLLRAQEAGIPMCGIPMCGVPIVVDGEVAGGVGLSSGMPQQDLECAEAAISHFLANGS